MGVHLLVNLDVNLLLHLPAMAKLGDIYDKNPAHALAQAESCGYVLAAELLAIGVDFSFAPVLDLDYAPFLKRCTLPPSWSTAMSKF
jgi:beta-glucosidase-like glycosyl hydrolase